MILVTHHDQRSLNHRSTLQCIYNMFIGVKVADHIVSDQAL